MPKRAVETGARRRALNMKTTDQLREKLERAAAASGRTLTQEVEYRVEQGFEEEQRRRDDERGGQQSVVVSTLLKRLLSGLSFVESETAGRNVDDEALISTMRAVAVAIVNDHFASKSLDEMTPEQADQTKSLAELADFVIDTLTNRRWAGNKLMEGAAGPIRADFLLRMERANRR